MTAQDMRRALEAHYTGEKYTLAYEVGMGGRYADAVAMCLWSSQEHNVQGHEIKASRSDWLRELKSPAKADAVAQYCDRWWVVTPPGSVKPGELPETWGLIEVVEGRLKVVTRADKVDNDRLETAVQRRTEAIVAESQQSLERERVLLKREYDPVIELVRDAEQKVGLSFRFMLDSAQLVALMRVASTLGLDGGSYQGLSVLAGQLRYAAENAAELAQQLEGAAGTLAKDGPSPGGVNS